ncbi:hypothetical protein [Flavobacterium macrobrachii]|uniref:Uncharacterized protein n=1 Tax=Flavobacterium macrobrachii TaxID=591204 RepID=A0ABS2CVJ1_9FLAO|nr:hypothetical protein [Flavobacterium macrobrachii]MBM6498988.1 hypothetical protein [Flavobacterium macrobrachii]
MYPEKIINSKNASFQITKSLNGGRCGWICRQLTKIANFIEDIPIVGPRFAGNIRVVISIVNAVDEAFFRTAGEYEPTYSESIILDNWQLNKLQPFYRNLTMKLSDAFKKNNLSQQLEEVNEILKIMCVVKSYFTNNELTGLSSNAINLRNELVDKILEPLYEVIETSFENQNLTPFQTIAKLDASTINSYYPLIENISILSTDCLNYKSNSTTNNTIPLIINDFESTPQPVVKKSDDNLIWIGLFFAGVIAITIFNSRENEKDKKKKK